jgi:hypothetical protein
MFPLWPIIFVEHLLKALHQLMSELTVHLLVPIIFALSVLLQLIFSFLVSG